MSEPMVSCAICLRKRDPHKHYRANSKEAPPAYAEQWLRRHCPHKDKCWPDGSPLCQISYRAGFDLRSLWVGQAKP